MFVEVMKAHVLPNEDIVWKKLGSEIDPETLKILSKVFRVLDVVVERNSVFKVETVGSEYMVVSGMFSSVVFSSMDLLLFDLYLIIFRLLLSQYRTSGFLSTPKQYRIRHYRNGD